VAGDSIGTHCDEIERCNQRGGRMLSIVDLIDAGTVTRELAAYALAAIGPGASFMVGALPGGAGKTTVMGAMLNFVPTDVELIAADRMATIERGLTQPTPRRCFICHEIGSGSCYAYLWAQELRAYFELPTAGHMLATNLHADTFEQAHAQVCHDNGVPEDAFRRMNLIFFLSVRRSGRSYARRIEEVWESDGTAAHQRIFDAGASASAIAGSLASTAEVAKASQVIDRLMATGAPTIEEVRAAILDWHG
jgi:hypothetical protein